MKTKRSGSNIFLRTLMAFLGIAILSLGTAFLRGGNVGLDPFTAINTGISKHLGLSLGVYQLIANFVIFLFVIFMDRHKIGIGTVLNMVLVGFEIQWFTGLYHQFFGSRLNIIIIISNLIIGLLLFTLGASMYMGADLGVAPYDAIAPILSERLHTQYRTIRITQDVIFTIGAVIASGPVGIGTIITAFFTGPLITYWDNHVSLPMAKVIDRIQDMSAGRQVGTMLTNLGKSSYNLVSRSYELTNLMQRRLSKYSPKDLEDQMRITRKNMEIAKAQFEGSERRYTMLREELQRRKQQAQQSTTTKDETRDKE